MELLTEMWAMIAARGPQLWSETGRHLSLVGAAIGAAVLIGVPLGILCHRVRSLRAPVLWLVGILQTVPSLAMLALLLILTSQTGFLPAWISLTLYALLPIVRNTVTGLEGVPDSSVEAARGVGMTAGQRLRLVELPLALPVIVAGLRTAAVISVGIATLAAFIGAGGLGVFIFRGLSMQKPSLLLFGAIPAAILALIVDGVIWAGEWASRPVRQSMSSVARSLRPVAIALPLGLIAFGLATNFVELDYGAAGGRTRGELAATTGTVTIGSKEFGEQLLLGEMMAQVIEAKTNLQVDRQFGLGGTLVCHEALRRDEIDLYAEYTGTGFQTILEADRDAAGPFSVYAYVDARYRERFGVDWLEPLGFNNTFAIAVRGDAAEANGWETVSDLTGQANELTAGFTAEFMERPDGYPGLKQAYGFSFGEATDISPDLMYEAVQRGEVDVICAFATDGRIEAYDLKVLQDDRGFFPPYDAAPVVGLDTLDAHPELAPALQTLAGLLNDQTMQRLNYAVTGEKRDPAEVAAEFLREQGLID
ncbi:MAG: ABC transporter permease subunit [Planctomycetes bacterium]|jgi:osmoprotectant transport system permease protein|nr:ABC transporter permease subunit [Phycisphaerae bacterium]NBB96522.1 ABC transporter permease subunit [Planctomycetota bacterium]